MGGMGQQRVQQFHAAAVALDGQGVLILGRSGAGKSALAMDLIMVGAGLVADDIVLAELCDGVIVLRRPTPRDMPPDAPPRHITQIEARGVGILNAPALMRAPLALCVDLDQTETARLPCLRTCRILGQDVTCLHRSGQTRFPAAIALYLRYGRYA